MALDGVDNDDLEETKLMTSKLTKYLDILADEEHEKEVVTYELARRETKEKLKRKENQTKNHGANKRLHKFKMAANHVTEMAAYTPDNDRCYNWREKHKRELLTIIIIEDVKMDRCLLLEIDKKKKIVKHWTMEWENKILEQRYIQTNLQITWEGSTYGNIERNNVKIQNKNGEDPTCRNVDGKNCGQQKLWTAYGQFQEDEKFFGQPS